MEIVRDRIHSVLRHVAIAAFIGLSGWWMSMFLRGLTEGRENDLFTLIYPLFSLFGSIIGFVIAHKWGGFKSALGKSLSILSLGLFAQFFGQAAYAYMIYIRGIEVPYPSIGDIGYFGSVLLYIWGAVSLGRVIGIKYALKKAQGKLLVLVVPVIALFGSYWFFLQGYEFDWTQPLTVILDFGYPLLQAFYVSIALLFVGFSSTTLGGVLKKPIMFLLVSLVAQYVSDFMFLYQANQGTWYVGGPNDYFYLISYFLMTLALMHLGHVFYRMNAPAAASPST